MNETVNRIKELRSRKGYSQEELAERSGLSLRTIQRIENGETEPRGDSLARLAEALGVTVGELAERRISGKSNLLAVFMNISALSFLWFPLLGIFVPLIIWLFGRGKNREQDAAARNLLNFQITWNLAFGVIFLIFMAFWASSLLNSELVESMIGGDPLLYGGFGREFGFGFGDIHTRLFGGGMLKTLGSAIWGVLLITLMYGYNLLMILVNVIRSFSGSRISYVPAIRFFAERGAATDMA